MLYPDYESEAAGEAGEEMGRSVSPKPPSRTSSPPKTIRRAASSTALISCQGRLSSPSLCKSGDLRRERAVFGRSLPKELHLQLTLKTEASSPLVRSPVSPYLDRAHSEEACRRGPPAALLGRRKLSHLQPNAKPHSLDI